jgi:hypothetical protein
VHRALQCSALEGVRDAYGAHAELYIDLFGMTAQVHPDAASIDLVPAFIEHSLIAHPHGSYELALMDRLPVADRSVAGMLAWNSLIHLLPGALDGVLAEIRRVIVPTGAIVAGFFDGDDVAALEDKVVTAWVLGDRLRRPMRRVGPSIWSHSFCIGRWHASGDTGSTAHAPDAPDS